MDKQLSPDHRQHQQEEWLFETNRSHILNSKCTSSIVCDKTRKSYENEKRSTAAGTPRKSMEQYLQIKHGVNEERNLCNYCKYDLILSMAHFPDMTYASNYLRLTHKRRGLVMEFNAMDALAPVIIKSYGLPAGLKVSASEAWLRSRMDCEYTRNVCNADFDWTFSTDYAGTFIQNKCQLREDQTPLSDWIKPSDERIDMEKLKIRKHIDFFDEIELFEDELADHGVAKCSVKIRVHPDSFYILCRFFLRVDRVFVRYFDTRIYHEFDIDYLLRERSQRESTIAELNLPTETAPALLIDPQQLFSYVPLKSVSVEKINLN